MPTGLRNSPGPIGSGSTPLTGLSPRTAINRTVRLKLTANLTPQNCGSCFVPPGTTVQVRAHNGDTAGNTGPIYVGLNREEVLNYALLANVLTPDTEISFPVDDTNQIWVSGNTNDGVIVTVRGATQI